MEKINLLHKEMCLINPALGAALLSGKIKDSETKYIEKHKKGEGMY